MRGSKVVLCFSLALGLCAMVLATASLLRGDAPVSAPPPPVQQSVLPEVAATAANASLDSTAPATASPEVAAVATNASPGSTPPATASPRELVRPTVTLKNPRISIQTAATQVCAQAGMQYDFNRSQQKAGDKCRLYIQVNLENSTLDEALAQIVLKNGLRYRMEGQSLWLEMPN